MNDGTDNVTLATELTVAWLSNPNTRVDVAAVPAFLESMHSAVAQLGEASSKEGERAPEHVPAVSVRKSLASPDHIISLIDGKPYKALRRHLSGHGLTPDEYRRRYGLKSDYPMVARGYSEARRSLAVARGLGRKVVAKVEEVAEATVAKVEAAVEGPAPKAGKGKPRGRAKAGDAASTKTRKAAGSAG